MGLGDEFYSGQSKKAVPTKGIPTKALGDQFYSTKTLPSKAIPTKALGDQFYAQKGSQSLPPTPNTIPTPTQQGSDFSAMNALQRGVGEAKSQMYSAIGDFKTADKIIKGLPPEAVPSYKDAIGFSGKAKFVAEKALEGLPLIAGAIGAGEIAPILGIAALGVTTLGSSRKAIHDRGGEGTVLQALPAAIPNTALNLLGVGKVVKSLGLANPFIKTVEKVATENPTLMKKVRDIAIDIGLEKPLTFGAISTLQNVNDMISSKFFSNQEVLSLSAEDLSSLKETFFGGVATGLGLGIGTHSIHPLVDKIQTQLQEKRKASLYKKVDGVVGDILQETKSQIDATDQILQDAGDAATLDPIVVFEGLRGEHHGKTGTLPVDGNQQSLDLNPQETSAKIGEVPISTSVDGKSVEVPLNQLTKRVHLIAEKDKISAIGDDKVSHQHVLKEVQNLYNKVLKRMGIQSSIALGELSTVVKLFNKPLKDLGGSISSPEYNMIGLDISGIFKGAKSKTEAFSRLVQIASHELGHSLSDKLYNEASFRTKSALLHGYRKWLTEIESLSVKDFYKKYDPLGQDLKSEAKHFNNLNISMREYLGRMSAENRGALLSFKEYSAQQFARAMTGKYADFIPAEKTHFKTMVRFMQRFWSALKSSYSATPTFQAWIDGYFHREKLRTLLKGQEELANPSGERKAILGDLAPLIKVERDVPLRENRYEPETYNAFADILDTVGLSRQADDMRQHQDIHLGFMRLKYLLTPLQIKELAKQKGISNPSIYMDKVRELENTKMGQVIVADEILQKWKALGDEQSTKLGNFLFEVSTQSDDLGRRLTDTELTSLRAQHNLSDEAFQVWSEIDQSFIDVLVKVERGLVMDAAKSFIPDDQRAKEFRDAYLAAPDAAAKLDLILSFTDTPLLSTKNGKFANPLFEELNRIQHSLEDMKNRNYFPRTRMGEYTITIKSEKGGMSWDGKEAMREGETIGFYSFDTAKERDAMKASLLPDVVASGVSMSSSIMDSEVFAMMGMPDVLIKSIMHDQKLNLTADQQEQLNNISLNLSPGKKFLRHLKKRKGIAGFSTDAVRVFTNYMMSAATHISRVEHSKSLIESLQAFDKSIQEAERNNLGGDIGDLVKLKNYYRKHFDYIMRPDKDWATLRSIGFLWYLGFNAKSAVVNLTQIPMITQPFLGAKFGDVRSLRYLAKAMKHQKNKLDGKLPADEVDMYEKLRQMGILDESMVMEVAGMGEGDILQRMIPGWKRKNTLNKVNYYGAMMFRTMEKFNRSATALAAYRLARDTGHPDPITFAKEAIEKTQFEYAKWNRAEFMRGKKSAIFLFWQYMQHSSFLFAGGEGSGTAKRMWAMALLTAGVQGLPFAQTLIEAVDLLGTKGEEMLGVDNPRVSVTEWMRDLLLNITDTPDLILHGASREWGLGPLHALSLMGVPIPDVDISGSLSFGAPVRALDELFVGDGSPNAELGKLTAAVLGPIGGMAIQAYRAASSDNPDTWKRIQMMMPVFIKNAMQGGRWLYDQKVTSNGGGTFLKMDDTEARVSSILKMLGFQPTRLSQKYEQITAEQSSAVYWTVKRSLLFQDYAFAAKIGDREGMADVTKAIRKFNMQVRKLQKLHGLGIASKDLRASVRGRLIGIRKRELGIATSGRQQGLVNEARRLFPVSGN